MRKAISYWRIRVAISGSPTSASYARFKSLTVSSMRRRSAVLCPCGLERNNTGRRRAELRPLIYAGKKTGRPQARARSAERAGKHHYISRQIAAFRTQAVESQEPRLGRPPRPKPVWKKHLRRRVVDLLGVNCADDRHFVGYARQMRQQFGDLLPALAVPRQT